MKVVANYPDLCFCLFCVRQCSACLWESWANIGTRHHSDALPVPQVGSPQLNPLPELLTSQRHVSECVPEVCGIKVPKDKRIASTFLTQQCDTAMGNTIFF